MPNFLIGTTGPALKHDIGAGLWNSKKPDAKMIALKLAIMNYMVHLTFLVGIAKISSLSLPDDAKILYRSESDRGKNKTFIYRIIYSKNEFEINNYKTVKVSTRSAYKSIRSSLENIDLGLPAEFFLTYRWANEDGEWYGIWLETSEGFYLNLEQITTKAWGSGLL